MLKYLRGKEKGSGIKDLRPLREWKTRSKDWPKGENVKLMPALSGFISQFFVVQLLCTLFLSFKGRIVYSVL